MQYGWPIPETKLGYISNHGARHYMQQIRRVDRLNSKKRSSPVVVA